MQVDIKGIGRAEFPDDMSREDIRAFLANKYSMDHGVRSAGVNEQNRNLDEILAPVWRYLSGVRSRLEAFGENPAEALYKGFAETMGLNLDRPISEYAQMAKNPQGGQIDPNSPAIQEAMSWIPGPTGAIGMIAGPGAKTANLDLLKRAQELKDAGKSQDDIFKKTGWWLDHPDGVPRFEIDDSAVAFSDKEMKRIGTPGGIYKTEEGEGIRKFMGHDQLFEAYPELENVKIGTTGSAGKNAYYNEADNTISLDNALKESTGLFAKTKIPTYQIAEDQPEIIIHELQHAIQKIENMARGGNIEQLIAEFGSLDKAQDIYNRLSAEVEARLAASRKSLTKGERVSRPFYKEYDVPIEEQIVKKENK